ncbi:MAG TPA: hypothetical protein VLR69_11775 [Thermoanaerobaculia bacterium]|jgi:hypothetical protein|nr:hypothetical protein [Thermoanaerobaculia bacterium]
MKKHKGGGRAPIEEIVSLNDELFSLVTGDPLAALDERLANVVAGGLSCDSYTCSSFGGCGSFSCGTFKVI